MLSTDLIIVGRGESSERFWERFPRQPNCIVCAINPGSTPRAQAVSSSDGRHRDCASRFDILATLDIYYLQKRGFGFLDDFSGPVYGMDEQRRRYKGKGQFVNMTEAPGFKLKSDHSLAFAVDLGVYYRARSITLVGADYPGLPYEENRKYLMLALSKAERAGIPCYREAHAPWDHGGLTRALEPVSC